MSVSCQILTLIIICAFGQLSGHQVYPPIPDNVRPIQQIGAVGQPIPPPLQQPVGRK